MALSCLGERPVSVKVIMEKHCMTYQGFYITIWLACNEPPLKSTPISSPLHRISIWLNAFSFYRLDAGPMGITFVHTAIQRLPLLTGLFCHSFLQVLLPWRGPRRCRDVDIRRVRVLLRTTSLSQASSSGPLMHDSWKHPWRRLRAVDPGCAICL